MDSTRRISSCLLPHTTQARHRSQSRPAHNNQRKPCALHQRNHTAHSAVTRTDCTQRISSCLWLYATQARHRSQSRPARTITSANHAYCISTIMSRTPPLPARTAHAASAPACGYTPRKLDLAVKAASTPLCRPGLRRQTTFFSSQRSPRYRHTKNAPRTAQSVIIAIHTALSPSPYQAST